MQASLLTFSSGSLGCFIRFFQVVLELPEQEIRLAHLEVCIAAAAVLLINLEHLEMVEAEDQEVVVEVEEEAVEEEEEGDQVEEVQILKGWLILQTTHVHRKVAEESKVLFLLFITNTRVGQVGEKIGSVGSKQVSEGSTF